MRKPGLIYHWRKAYLKVDVHLGERILASVPYPLFDASGHVLTVWRPITGFSYDGERERFLFVRVVEPAACVERAQRMRITHLNLVTNWFSELNRLAPADS